jgi:hypothetical protein
MSGWETSTVLILTAAVVAVFSEFSRFARPRGSVPEGIFTQMTLHTLASSAP